MTKALEGIRVLDLSRVLAGPYCTQMLGDLGAEILKIEKPGAGDDTRYWGPPFLKDKKGMETTESAYYLSVNRNKKSVAIDISQKKGQALILKLLEGCDILIENFKVGGLEKFGLSYDQLKKKFPKLIYCSITGFGQDGPMSHEPGYDLMAQAMAGLMSVTGEAEGTPMKVGVALSDILTGMNAAIGILSALHAREKTGKGQQIDVALIDSTLASLTNLAQYYLTSEAPAPRFGNAHSTIVPYEAFETKDGHIVVAVGNDNQFKKFAEFLGNKGWGDDVRFAKNSARVKNRDILVPLITKALKQKPSSYWAQGLLALDVPVGPVNKMDEVFAMPQVQHRKMQISLNHKVTGQDIPLVGSPLKLSETPVSYSSAPPVLGQDTQEVLEKLLRITPDEVRTLAKSGIIEITG